jgi:hypothetical protein
MPPREERERVKPPSPLPLLEDKLETYWHEKVELCAPDDLDDSQGFALALAQSQAKVEAAENLGRHVAYEGLGKWWSVNDSSAVIELDEGGR